jgi:CubicO group peptidase (beta-lactamase class C family)
MRKNFLLQLLLCSCFLSGHAQTGLYQPQLAGIDRQVISFMKNWDIKGGAVAISKNGKLFYSRGFGYANAAETKAVDPDAIFRIASVSKPLTSMAIMKLVEEGKLRLSDTVFGKNKILSDPYYLDVVKDKRILRITVQNLLEHTAGWDREVGVDGYDHNDPAFFPLHVCAVENEKGPVGDSTLIRYSVRKGLVYAPGIYFSYSNVGYLVLGKVIEKISGMAYESFVCKNILEPAGATHTFLGYNLKEKKFPTEVEYISDDRTLSCYGTAKLVPWQYGGFNFEAMKAHGGWVSTAPDLCRLLLTVDGKKDYPELLSEKTLELMTEPSETNINYAKGWSTNKSGNIWHTGSLDGTSAFVCRTADGYTWAFLFNGRADNSAPFWKSLDRLPWNCLKTVKEIPDSNLLQ